jgi:hypothetical protein
MTHAFQSKIFGNESLHGSIVSQETTVDDGVDRELAETKGVNATTNKVEKREVCIYVGGLVIRRFHVPWGKLVWIQRKKENAYSQY